MNWHNITVDPPILSRTSVRSGMVVMVTVRLTDNP